VSSRKPHSAGHADVDAANQVMVIYQINYVKAGIIKRCRGVWFAKEQHMSVNAPSPRKLLVPASLSRKAAIGSEGDGLIRV
jgi:hypothetical protein